MKQVLSQEEIDSLLKAINSGEMPAEESHPKEESKIKPYDFRRPFKLSREYIDALYMIFENFAKLAEISISNQILTNVDMQIKAIEQISFEEFLRSTLSSTVMGIFKSEPLLANQIIAFSPHLCMQAIEIMCGGSSRRGFNEDKKTEFTDIELSILEEVISGVLKSFEVAWKEVIEVKTEIETIGAAPQVGQAISPNEPVILITFAIEIDEQKNFINICMPYLSFDNIMDKLSIRNRFKNNQKMIEEYQTLITKHLMNVQVKTETLLGKSLISVEDILDLDTGDIIQLDMGINEPLGLYIENLKYFRVKPGQIDGKLAVEVVDYLEEEEGDKQ